MNETTQRRLLLGLSMIFCLLQQIIPAVLVAGVALLVVKNRRTTIKVLQPFALLLSVWAVKGAFGLILGLISEIIALTRGAGAVVGSGAGSATALLGWTSTVMTVVDLVATAWLVVFLILGFLCFFGKEEGNMPLYGDLVRSWFRHDTGVRDSDPKANKETPAEDQAEPQKVEVIVEEKKDTSEE